MKRGLVGLGLLLCALPAHGEEEVDEVDHALSPIDELPGKEELIQLVGADPVPELRLRIFNEQRDPGTRLRAIRALPEFCVPSCKTTINEPAHPARGVLLEVFERIIELIDVPTRVGEEVLWTQAWIESLALTRSGLQSDVDLIAPFLDDPNRDIRTTTARALGRLCMESAKAPLRSRNEGVPQVQIAIGKALDALETCTPP